jgi:hypothetical protein
VEFGVPAGVRTGVFVVRVNVGVGLVVSGAGVCSSWGVQVEVSMFWMFCELLGFHSLMEEASPPRQGESTWLNDNYKSQF